MTRKPAPNWEDRTRLEAAAAWFNRVGFPDDPPSPEDLEAFELWKADSPENVRMFNIVKDEMLPYDNPLFRFLLKERVAALEAESDAKD